ncbi:hypothetical protein FBU30_006033 [Linnemannia zychae]|nr:hypothetical protein FBU30_006033 [Linnemannia zychae]
MPIPTSTISTTGSALRQSMSFSQEQQQRREEEALPLSPDTLSSVPVGRSLDDIMISELTLSPSAVPSTRTITDRDEGDSDLMSPLVTAPALSSPPSLVRTTSLAANLSSLASAPPSSVNSCVQQHLHSQSTSQLHTLQHDTIDPCHYQSTAYSRVKQTIVENTTSPSWQQQQRQQQQQQQQTHNKTPLETMTDYWHTLSMPRLQHVQQPQSHCQHNNSGEKELEPTAGCLSDASDSSTQTMRLFIDTTPASFQQSTATGVTAVGSTPPSSASPSSVSSCSSSLASSPVEEAIYLMHVDKKLQSTISKTSKIGGALSPANCKVSVHSETTSVLSSTSNDICTAPTAATSVSRRSLSQSVRTSSCEQGRLSTARSRTSLNRFMGNVEYPTGPTEPYSSKGDISHKDSVASRLSQESSVRTLTSSQQAHAPIRRAKFFFCEDSDDESDSDYEYERELHQPRDKEAAIAYLAHRHPLTTAPLLQTVSSSCMPTAIPPTAEMPMTIDENCSRTNFQEYDEYNEYDHEDDDESYEDDDDEDDGPLFFGKNKPAVTITATTTTTNTTTTLPQPQQSRLKMSVPPVSGRRHLPSPVNAGMERRQSLLSDLLLAEKQQKQLLHQQKLQQRSQVSSACSTPNCHSAASSDGEDGTFNTSVNTTIITNDNNGINDGGRSRYSTKAMTPIYPATSATTRNTTILEHQHPQCQALEPNRIHLYHRPTMDGFSMETIVDENAEEFVPKLVRTKKFFGRLDTLAATSDRNVEAKTAETNNATAPASTCMMTTSPISASTTSLAYLHSPLSPTTSSTCKISTLSPTTTTTTTTKTTVAPVGATSVPVSPAFASASAVASAAAAAAAASASAATMAGWARSQVQVQLQSLVAQSTTTAQRAFMNASATLSDVLYRTTGTTIPGHK